MIDRLRLAYLDSRRHSGNRPRGFWTWLPVLLMITAHCARIPYPTETLRDDHELLVRIDHEVHPAGYTHPAVLTENQLTSILQGFTIKERETARTAGLRARATVRRPLLTEREIHLLAPALAEALQKAGPEERAYFEVRAPGNNPAFTRNVVAGWMAVRDPLLYLTIEFHHVEVPMTSEDPYFQSPRYPAIRPAPIDYQLEFQPDHYYVADAAGASGLRYREFLQAGMASPR